MPPLPRGEGQRVLVAVADPGEAELVATTLELAGYRHTLSADAARTMELFAQQDFDLIIIDVDLPRLAGLAHGRRVPPAERPPVLFLTAHQSLPGVVEELGPGAADYVTRPIRIAEVLARAKVLLRSGDHETHHRGRSSYADLVLDDATCTARRGLVILDLTPAEYRLLRHLLANAERVLSKEQISRHVWGEVRGDNAIEQLVSRLRRKVDHRQPALIRTRRGFGYWLGRPGGV
ncbi:MAG TPA: response regulator transcription factor [Actinospica sp.]|nr:response regulator transcription factor [Actinospica sp.]